MIRANRFARIALRIARATKGRSAGTGACGLFCPCFPKGPACQHLCQHSGQHPRFASTCASTLVFAFLEFPFWGPVPGRRDLKTSNRFSDKRQSRTHAGLCHWWCPWHQPFGTFIVERARRWGRRHRPATEVPLSFCPLLGTTVPLSPQALLTEKIFQRIMSCNLLPDNYQDKFQANWSGIHCRFLRFLAGIWEKRTTDYRAEIQWV